MDNYSYNVADGLWNAMVDSLINPSFSFILDHMHIIVLASLLLIFIILVGVIFRATVINITRWVRIHLLGQFDVY